MPLLGWSLLVILAPGPKLLLVAGSEESPTARGLRALGVPYERTAPGDFRRVSPFDYDLLVLGMDEARAPLAAAAAPLAAFVRAGGVVLGFRATGDETWLPVPVRHGKAYHLGAVEQPAHPLFTTPHRLDPKLLADVHGGSIYGALHALGEGWRPLLGTGAEQEWDRSPAGEPGPRHGLAELPWGRGTIVLCQMIPAYHWFNDRQGEAGCAGAKLFENLVRYAMSKAGTRAAERPPRRVPDGFHRRWENVVAAPRRGDGARLDGDGWRFSSQGAWSRTIDRRGVLTFTHADQPSAAGGFAQLTGTLTPPADGRVVLRWYCTDTYCGGREIVLGGQQHGQTALENFQRDQRFAQVLVNGQPVWSQDVCGRNPQPAREAFRTADVTDAVRAQGRCEVTLRVEDRAGSGDQPFAIDVFFATVELLDGLSREPAAEALRGTGFTPADGALHLAADHGVLTARHAGRPGPHAVAVKILDEPTGRSRLRLGAAGRPLADWTLTADDQRDYWAVSPVTELRAGEELKLELTAEGDERPLLGELAVIPERWLTRAAAAPTIAAAAPARSVAVTLTVPETAGVARAGEIASQGLPFPAGCLKEPTELRLTGDGPVPLQTRTIARWPDGSVKSALVSFPVTVAAGGATALRLSTGAAAAPTGSLAVREEAEAVVIETGAIIARFSTRTGRLVDEVTRGGQVVKPAGELWSMALATESGRLLDSAGATVERCTLLERGPLRAVLLRTGKLADADGRLVDYRLTTTLTAGSDLVRCEATIINREATPEIYLKRWSVDLQRAGAAGGRVWLGADEPRAAGDGAVLYQHREDTLSWTGADRPVARAEGKSPGLVRLPGLAVVPRWFWQRYPQAVRWRADGVRFDLIPEAFDDGDLPVKWRDRLLELTDKYSLGGVGYPQSPGKMGLFRLAQGEALSWEAGFVFDGLPASAAPPARAAELTAPLRACPEPSYVAATQVFGALQPADRERFGPYEESVERAYRGYLAAREKRREYGFENFGDDTFEWGYGPSYTFWSNSEYDHHHGFALQYLRSGDPKWWTLCEETARHYRDVVVIHHATNERLVGGPHHHNAVTMWMPQHDEQYWIADHTMAGASAGHSWVEGLIDYWLLTGDPWSEEVVGELERWYCGIAERNEFGAGGQERGPGWALIAISALARATGGERIREAGWIVADWLLDWQDPIRGVISVPISEQPSYEGGSTFMHGIVGRGLGRWHEVTGDPRVRDALVGVAEWITTEPMGEMGRFWYKQSPQNSKRFGATDQCLSALTYAYAATGDAWFAQVAEKLLALTSANVRSMSWYPQALGQLPAGRAAP